MIELDFQERYGIDLEAVPLTTRSARWLRLRIIGLLGCESRLHQAMYPPTNSGR